MRQPSTLSGAALGGEQPVAWESLAGWAEDDHAEAFAAFRAAAPAVLGGVEPLRAACEAGADLRAAAAALASAPLDTAAARRFFETRFRPFRTGPPGSDGRPGPGFVTGYYEPVVEGSRVRSASFTAPILARPPDMPRLAAGVTSSPYPARAVIESAAEAGEGHPIVWLRDWAEVFFIHVQGSARVALEDGSAIRLVYDGRNGHPYVSIGRRLVESGALPLAEARLDGIKAWIRRHGQAMGEAGRALMWANPSYIYFREAAADDRGPTGGAGVALLPLRSAAVDRGLLPYGLPVHVAGHMPWAGPEPTPFRRLLVAMDTGSAIVGPGRLDLFLGSGAEAGRRAGDLRHAADVTVLRPVPVSDDTAGR